MSLPMARLARLAGRGRALEILHGNGDIPAALAAQYGYVNRVAPDAELEEFTDRFARRIGDFDKAAVAGIKQLVDVASLLDDAEFTAGLAYYATTGQPENSLHRVGRWDGAMPSHLKLLPGCISRFLQPLLQLSLSEGIECPCARSHRRSVLLLDEIVPAELPCEGPEPDTQYLPTWSNRGEAAARKRQCPTPSPTTPS